MTVLRRRTHTLGGAGSVATYNGLRCSEEPFPLRLLRSGERLYRDQTTVRGPCNQAKVRQLENLAWVGLGAKEVASE